jgi:membrane-bound lytic murein transglycosylase D
MQGRNSKAVLYGTLIVSVSLLTAWAVDGNRGVAAPEAAPMDRVLDATASRLGVNASGNGAAGKSAVTWDLPVTRNSHVDGWIGFLQGRNAKLTRKWLGRSTRYTPLVKEQLRARQMPEDLTYLAFIESGYNPNAHSRAAAVGLWQFISETGKRYGLEVGTYVDERRDPIKATDAALDYLQELYDRFGSWYLAAAAYNTGENRVARIMREETGSERGRDEDFWRIASRLPAETRNYVPLMLAAGHIGKEPDQYGFADVEYQAPLAYDTVRVPADIPLAAVAKAVGADADSIFELNPELVRQQTPPNREWYVRIPVGTRDEFAANFPTDLHALRLAAAKARATTARPSRLAKSTRMKSKSSHTIYAGRSYRVKRGDTLSEIAQRHGVTVRALVKANGGMVPSELRAGQTLRLPKRNA